MAFHHTLFQLRELLIWLHLILQVQASKQTIWWQVHSPRNEWICMNLLGKFSLLAPVRGQKQISYFSSKCTGVNARCCQGLLQSSECSIWPALLKQGYQADSWALASIGLEALGKWSIFAMVLASLPQMSPSVCSPWLHCRRWGHWPSRGRPSCSKQVAHWSKVARK